MDSTKISTKSTTAVWLVLCLASNGAALMPQQQVSFGSLRHLCWFGGCRPRATSTALHAVENMATFKKTLKKVLVPNHKEPFMSSATIDVPEKLTESGAEPINPVGVVSSPVDIPPPVEMTAAVADTSAVASADVGMKSVEEAVIADTTTALPTETTLVDSATVTPPPLPPLGGITGMDDSLATARPMDALSAATDAAVASGSSTPLNSIPVDSSAVDAAVASSPVPPDATLGMNAVMEKMQANTEKIRLLLQSEEPSAHDKVPTLFGYLADGVEHTVDAVHERADEIIGSISDSLPHREDIMSSMTAKRPEMNLPKPVLPERNIDWSDYTPSLPERNIDWSAYTLSGSNIKSTIVLSWNEFLTSLVALRGTLEQDQWTPDEFAAALNFRATAPWYLTSAVGIGLAVAFTQAITAQVENDDPLKTSTYTYVNPVPQNVIEEVKEAQEEKRVALARAAAASLLVEEQVSVLNEATAAVYRQLAALKSEKAAVDVEVATMRSDLMDMKNQLVSTQEGESELRTALQETQERLETETVELRQELEERREAEILLKTRLEDTEYRLHEETMKVEQTARDILNARVTIHELENMLNRETKKVKKASAEVQSAQDAVMRLEKKLQKESNKVSAAREEAAREIKAAQNAVLVLETKLADEEWRAEKARQDANDEITTQQEVIANLETQKIAMENQIQSLIAEMESLREELDEQKQFGDAEAADQKGEPAPVFFADQEWGVDSQISPKEGAPVLGETPVLNGARGAPRTSKTMNDIFFAAEVSKPVGGSPVELPVTNGGVRKVKKMKRMAKKQFRPSTVVEDYSKLTAAALKRKTVTDLVNYLKTKGAKTTDKEGNLLRKEILVAAILAQ